MYLGWLAGRETLGAWYEGLDTGLELKLRAGGLKLLPPTPNPGFLMASASDKTSEDADSAFFVLVSDVDSLHAGYERKMTPRTVAKNNITLGLSLSIDPFMSQSPPCHQIK